MAKSKRSKKQCLKWAMRGKGTCYMHGGTSKGPKIQAGKEHSRQASLRHGGHTQQAKTHQKKAMDLIH